MNLHRFLAALPLRLGVGTAALASLLACYPALGESLLARAARAELRWWGWGTVVAGLGLIVLLVRARRRSSRSGMVIFGACGVAGLAAGVAYWVRVVPDPSPVRPVDLAVIIGLAALGWLVVGCGWGVLVASLRDADPDQTPGRTRAPARSRPSRIAAGATASALLLSVVFGWSTIATARALVIRVNEYRVLGEVDRPAGPVVPSTLTGGLRWRTVLDGLVLPGPPAAGPAVTPYGMGMTVGDDLVMIDRTTGAVRWRYLRSDVDGAPTVASVLGGEAVLATWDRSDLSYLVLDARTGERRAHWPNRYADDSLQASDPVLLGRQRAVGSDSVARVEDGGRERWRFAPGRCLSVSADVSTTTALVRVDSGCGDPDRLVGLDLDDGRERWSVAAPPGSIQAVVGETALSAPRVRDDARTLTAIDATTGRFLWSRQIVGADGSSASCPLLSLSAAAESVRLICRDTEVVAGRNLSQLSVTTYDLADGTAQPVIRLRRQADAIGSVGVTDAGRVVAVIGSRATRSCHIELLAPERRRLLSFPEDEAEVCQHLRTVVIDDQVLVLDTKTSTLSALR